MLWIDSNNTDNDRRKPFEAVVTQKKTSQFNNIQITGKPVIFFSNKDSKDTVCASSGFSEGMKRQIESVETNNMSEKRKCLIVHNKTTRINSLLDSSTEQTEQTMSVSSVSGLTPLTENMTSSSILHCSDNWKHMQQTFKVEEKQNKKQILSYVKDHLFKDLKFIPSQEMMHFSNQENSLNHYVCKALNIRMEEQHSFWSKYYVYVEKALNAARNDAVSAVKKSFLKGKSLYCLYKKISSNNRFLCFIKITGKFVMRRTEK
jgi:hypothetical protein